MTPSVRAGVQAREMRDTVVDGVRVRLASAIPAAGESLSVAARTLGEDLVASWTGMPARVARVAALPPSGRPIVIGHRGASGIDVSLAHESGMVAAAIGIGGGVGVDVVDVSVSRDGLLHWMDAAERDLAAGTSPSEVWGAKEAAYKASAIDAPFDPHATMILPTAPGRFRWTVHGRWRREEGEGLLLRRGRHVVAVAAAHRLRSPGPTRPPAAIDLGAGLPTTRFTPEYER